ncbi:uncharacterized protein [Dermacentor albipictus]|uniref:uncharacterized protein isoform X3 n=1 Tax=Dermacentor albipictus TaxID=60249 RepID=UPI0038FC77DA
MHLSSCATLQLDCQELFTQQWPALDPYRALETERLLERLPDLPLDIDLPRDPDLLLDLERRPKAGEGLLHLELPRAAQGPKAAGSRRSPMARAGDLLLLARDRSPRLRLTRPALDPYRALETEGLLERLPDLPLDIDLPLDPDLRLDLERRPKAGEGLLHLELPRAAQGPAAAGCRRSLAVSEGRRLASIGS